MTLDLHTRPDRCEHGFAPVHHPDFCNCADAEWVIFTRAIRQAARPDGTVHVNDVRPLIRGRIKPRAIGRLYQRAKAEGLLTFDRKEPSTDQHGRNTHHDAVIYRLAA